MWGKLVNGALVKAPVCITVGEFTVWNATAEEYKEQGWYPVIYTEEPVVDEWHYAEPSWVQEEDCIRRVWTIEVLPEPSDEDELSDDDVMKILTGASV